MATQLSSPKWWFEGPHVRVGVLVGSMPGKLPVQRYAREDDLPLSAVDDYAAAVQRLEGAAPGS